MPSDFPMYANKTIPRKNRRNGMNITKRIVKDKVSNIETEDMIVVFES